MPSAKLHYFSGTGNSKRLGQIIKQRLQEADLEVVEQAIEKPKELSAGQPGLNVFTFPVYAFVLPAIVERYLNRLPEADGAKAAVVVAFGNMSMCGKDYLGDEGVALEQAARILRRKKYDLFFAAAVGYPENVTQVVPLRPEKQVQFIAQGDEKANEIAEKIVSQVRYFKHASWLNQSWMVPVGLLYSIIGRRALGKLCVADSSCDLCLKCVRACPVKAIKVLFRKPRWNYNCEGCQRCINLCPKKSIQTSAFRLIGLIGLFFLTNQITASLKIEAGLNLIFGFLLGGVLTIFFWLVIGFILVAILDVIIFLLEVTPGIRGVFGWGHTRLFGRYLAPGFNPLDIK